MERFLNRLRKEVPINIGEHDMKGKRAGIIVVDVLKGFCKPGCGPLAPPPSGDRRISTMVDRVEKICRYFTEDYLPILVLKDCHDSKRPEPPYPVHCLKGSEEAELMDELKWLETKSNVTIMEKDCIDGFIGGMMRNGQNYIVNWINTNRLEAVIVVGVCTDVCDMDLVLSLLSARNHELFSKLREVIVYEPACQTYDLPREIAEGLGRPSEAAHPRELTHYMSLYFMASRGAIIANSLLE